MDTLYTRNFFKSSNLDYTFIQRRKEKNAVIFLPLFESLSMSPFSNFQPNQRVALQQTDVKRCIRSSTDRCRRRGSQPTAWFSLLPNSAFHRNMPKDQAMDFVQAEYNRGLAKERPPRDPADIAAEASQLLDDFLDREKIARHTVPSETRQLLVLLAEGVHLYPEELETISEYVRSRQDHIQASNSEGEKGIMLPPGLGKPPPLLPTPSGPPQPQPASLTGGPMGDHASPSPVPLLPSPVAHPKTKPPPLLSLHRLPGPSLGGPIVRGPLSSHIPYGGPGVPRGPLLHPPPVFHPGPRGPTRGAPPTLKSARPPLLSSPGAPLLRQSVPRH
uniref:Si:ch211-216l23.2 n=1 Tax=Oreochromis niloticus TaxID=8128 RepID=A0A669CE76_ORENI